MNPTEEKLFSKIMGKDVENEVERQIAFCEKAILDGDEEYAIENCINALAWRAKIEKGERLDLAQERIKYNLRIAFKLNSELNATGLLVQCEHCGKNVFQNWKEMDQSSSHHLEILLGPLPNWKEKE